MKFASALPDLWSGKGLDLRRSILGFVVAYTCSLGATLAWPSDVVVRIDWPPASGAAAAGGTDESGTLVPVVVPADRAAVAATVENAPGGVQVEWIGNARWSGWSIAFVRVRGASELSAIELGLETRFDDAPHASIRRPRLLQAAQHDLEMYVANPGDVARFAPRLAAAPGRKASRGFVPTAYPDLEGSPVEYLILTPPDFVASFQVLADWKTKRGVPAVVRSTDFALTHARAGSDAAETLRNFIRDAYELWGIRWVLLAGDTDLIPCRFAYTKVLSSLSTYQSIPTDLYYACLDGTWNANGNELFGEAPPSAPTPGDAADLYPEVFVSRAPVTTLVEADGFVQKTIGYETPLATTYQDRALLLAEVLSPAAYDSGDAITLDGATASEGLMALFPGSIDVTRMYETSFLYPGSTPLSRALALNALNTGPHFVNHMGHGFRFNMSVGDASIVNPDADAASNGSQTFVLFLLNCTALAFDSNSLGERFMLAPGGGAVAVVGSSREAYPSSSVLYNQEFYEQLFAGFVHFGETVVRSRLPRTGFTFFETQDRWTHLILNALGDPELMVFRDTPRAAVVTIPPSVDLATTSLDVTVEVDAAPVDSARVCVMKGVETYAVGWTDASGQVTLDVQLQVSGLLFVTVSGQDVITVQDTIFVVPPPAPHAYVAAVAVDDDSVGASSGNADGVLDAGETIEFQVHVGNSGSQPLQGAWAHLATTSPPVTLSADSVALGSLVPAGPLSAATFVFSLDAGAPDGTPITLEVQYQDSLGAPLGSELLQRRVHAPATEVVELLRSANGGASQVHVVLKNFGSGAQPPFTAALSSSDPQVSVLSGATTFPEIPSFATGTCNTAFLVVETDTTQANAMQFAATDTYGRTLDFDFELRGTSLPEAPVFDASTGPTTMRLTWPPDSTMALGYHVYRRPAGMGAMQRASTDIVRARYFLDRGLQPSTRYDYAVAAVDSSYLLSGLSLMATASTNPKQLNGWPMVMEAATASSVAIGDIDGDGDLEVVTGNNGIYAWHANGAEVRDGDNDALTWGVFLPPPPPLENATVTASIALGEVDPQRPGLEIVAARWLQNRIYVYDAAGNVLPGWPVQPSKGGAQGFWGTPAVLDMDGDGSAEILAISKDGWLYGFRSTGAPLVGADGAYAFLGGFTRTSPLPVNLDSDSTLEIVAAGADGFLRAFQLDGSTVAQIGGANTSWPVNLGGAINSAPSVGDIDGNPQTPEIVVLCENDQMHVRDAFGVSLPGWPKPLSVDNSSFAPSPAIGDMNGDGAMDIAVVANESAPLSASEVRIYDGATGTILLQKNLGNRSESSPVLADMDGDNDIDMALGGESGVINAWDLQGNLLAGFPLTVGDFVRSTLAVADLDGDGDAEIAVAGWDQTVYVWDLGTDYDPETAPWPTHHGDVQRTKNAFLRPEPSPTDVARPRTPARLVVGPNVPNPFNPNTRIRFDLPRAGRVQVDVFDTRGRLLRSLLDQALAAGAHAVVWDGRDQSGRASASGVYWYRVQSGGDVQSRKMVLVR